MRNRFWRPALCVALAVLCVFSTGMTTLAAWRVQGDTINKVTMGSVHGLIREDWVDEQELFPGSRVKKRVQVENTGKLPEIVRVKVERFWGDTVDGIYIPDTDLSVENIQIAYNTDDWYYRAEDDFWYYKEILKPGKKTTPLFEYFILDGKTTNQLYSDKEAHIDVSMECIQTGGGAITFWGVTYEELGIEYKEPNDTTPVLTVAEFAGPDAGFIFPVNSGDLFANFKLLQPGESRSQDIQVGNTWSKDVEIFLWAEEIAQSHAQGRELELLEKLLKEYAQITITDDKGHTLYSGAIWGNPLVISPWPESMRFPLSLGSFATRQSKKLHVALTLDSRMDNEYIDLLGLIHWFFVAEGPDEPAPVEPRKIDPTTPDNSNSGTPTDGNINITPVPPYVPPNTGDSTSFWLWGSAALLSAGGCVVVLVFSKKRRNKETDQ
jgi:hypothetical protein